MPKAGGSAGGQPPRRLRPETGTAELFSLVEGLLEQIDTGGETIAEEKEEADRARTRLARLGADADLYRLLAERGFAGVEYEVFRSELAAYAVPVIQSFIRRKMIYTMCARAGRPVVASGRVREYLTRHVDDQLELACETIAHGLRLFERYALRGGGWSPEGGASLKTYFIGACVRSFPTAFKGWAADYDPDARALRFPSAYQSELRADDDPADEVVNLLRVQDYLDGMTPTTRGIAARIALLAETRKEAAEALGISERAAEGHVYRHRKEARRRDRGRGEA